VLLQASSFKPKAASETTSFKRNHKLQASSFKLQAASGKLTTNS
jgi:hypothetical protein